MPTALAVSSSRSRVAAGIAIAAAVIDLAILAAFHLLAPEVDPLTSPTSDYVHARGGFLSSLGTFATGVGALALVFALQPLTAGTRLRVGQVLLAVFGIAKVLQAFFPIAPVGVTTTSGALHNILGNLAFFLLPVAAILLSWPIARHTGQKAPGILALLVAITTVTVLVAAQIDLFGVGQRIYLVTAALWLIVSAVAVRRSRTH